MMARLAKSTLHRMLRQPEPFACNVAADADQCEGQSRVILMTSGPNVLTHALSHHERLSVAGSHRLGHWTIGFAPHNAESRSDPKFSLRKAPLSCVSSTEFRTRENANFPRRQAAIFLASDKGLHGIYPRRRAPLSCVSSKQESMQLAPDFHG